MKSILFAYYDKQIAAYSNPLAFQGDIDSLKTSIIRSLKGNKLKMENLDVIDMYFLGEYEDTTGLIVRPEKPVFLLSLCEYLPQAAQPVIKEVDVNGSEDKVS